MKYGGIGLTSLGGVGGVGVGVAFVAAQETAVVSTSMILGISITIVIPIVLAGLVLLYKWNKGKQKYESQIDHTNK